MITPCTSGLDIYRTPLDPQLEAIAILQPYEHLGHFAIHSDLINDETVLTFYNSVARPISTKDNTFNRLLEQLEPYRTGECDKKNVTFSATRASGRRDTFQHRAVTAISNEGHNRINTDPFVTVLLTYIEKRDALAEMRDVKYSQPIASYRQKKIYRDASHEFDRFCCALQIEEVVMIDTVASFGACAPGQPIDLMTRFRELHLELGEFGAALDKMMAVPNYCDLIGIGMLRIEDAGIDLNNFVVREF